MNLEPGTGCNIDVEERGKIEEYDTIYQMQRINCQIHRN